MPRQNAPPRPSRGPLLALACGCAGPVEDSAAPQPFASCPVTLTRVTELGAADFPGGDVLDGALATGPGVAIADVDGDGWLDAWVATPVAGTLLLRNDGAGALRPAAVVTADGAPLPSSRTAAALDADRDGLPDLLISGAAGDLLVRNLGLDGAAVRVSVEVLPASDGRVTYGFSVADADGDGLPEVFAARFLDDLDPAAVTTGAARGTGSALYEADADGALAVVPDAIPADHADDATYMGQWIDADDDGRLDLYLSNDFGAWVGGNVLLRNDGGLRFTARADTGAEVVGFTMGASAGDTDGDGRADLYVTDLARQSLLARVDGFDGDGFADVGRARGAVLPYRPEAFASWGSAIVDLDGSGAADVAVTFGRLLLEGGDLGGYPGLEGADWDDAAEQPDALFLNAGDGTFVDAAPDAGFDDPRVGRAVAVGDFDRDGRPDLLTAGIPYVTQWRTDGGCGPGMTVRVPHGAGARVTALLPDGRATAADHFPATTFSSSASEVYVPLAGASGATRLTLTLPNGETRAWDDVVAGAVLDAVGP
jgi:hypothetical protein